MHISSAFLNTIIRGDNMQSVWTDSVNFPNFDKLKKDIRTDVLIIGGGITGISCGYLFSFSKKEE